MNACPALQRLAAWMLILMVWAGSTAAQDLRVGNDAAIQEHIVRFDVHHPGRATQRVRRVVTVHGPNGRDAGELYVGYDDRLRHLRRLSGAIRDARGEVVRRLKRTDQEDYSAVSSGTLYEESRLRVARLYHDAYPYTVEFEYEVRFDGLINWPSWCPRQQGRPVSHARFELSLPADMEVRYHLQGGSVTPAVTQERGRRMLTWEVRNLPALVDEPLGPPQHDQALCVHTAPTVFEVEGTEGDMRSWESFGRWYHALSEGRDSLPDEVLRAVQRRTQGITDTREKVRLLYEYMQERTRYVNVSLGLGGWQPHEAAYVHERGYGDCKALTNYLHALLKEAGVVSYPALLRSGTGAPAVMAAFPSNQFDHVVLAVPLATDTLWLENTSSLKAFGQPGAFIEGRFALLVKPEGGELVRIPASRARDNRQIHHARVELSPTGDVVASIRMRFTGNQQEERRQTLASRSPQEREQWLRATLDLPGFTLVRADWAEVETRRTSVAVPVDLEIPRYAARVGDRLFLTVNMLERWSYVPPPSTDRSQPVKAFPYAFADADTIRYVVPENFAVEAMPEPVEVETGFGRYRAEVVLQADGTLTYHRSLEITTPTLPAEDYPAYRAFLQQVARADGAQVVLVRR